MHLREILEQSIDQMEDRQGDRALITGVPTGYTRLDQLTSGFQGSNLITICGVTGIGKRALAYNIAINASIDGNKRISILNLSLDNTELSMRFLCSAAMVDSSRIRSGFLSKDDWHKLTNAAGALSDAEIYIINDSSMISHYECDLLIIDSFQRLRSKEHAANIAHEQISYSIANNLKTIAMSKDIPVIILSSLNDWRIEQRSDKRPRLADFKYGYSALPDISDVVIGIYRDEIYNHDEINPNIGTAEVIIMKQRCGPNGSAILTFMEEYCRYENLT